MDRGLWSHRLALPACPVPKFPVEMVMLLQIRLPGPPNLGYRPPTGDISAPSSLPPCKKSSRTCTLLQTQGNTTPAAGLAQLLAPHQQILALAGQHSYPTLAIARLKANPSSPCARFLCPTGSSARDRARIKDVIAEGITRSPRWALRSQQIACAVGAGKHKTSCLCI